MWTTLRWNINPDKKTPITIEWSKITENAIFILFDKSLLGFDSDILYISVYIQPEGSTWYEKLESHCTNGITLFQEKLLEILSDLTDVYALCGGDFNARTGVQSDFVEDDIILYIANQANSMWDFILDYFSLERSSADKTVNKFGRCLLDLCSVLNIHIMNGRCGLDANVGDYTLIGVNQCD